MSRLVIDMPNPRLIARALRQSTSWSQTCALAADAIEAAADKRYVVLDLEGKEIVGDPAQHLYDASSYDRGEPTPAERHSLIVIAQQIEAQWSPRPSEPTGLGAVVKDSHGNLFVRVEGYGGLPRWIQSRAPEATDPRWVWSAIDAVEVLSEGVRDDA